METSINSCASHLGSYHASTHTQAPCGRGLGTKLVSHKSAPAPPCYALLVRLYGIFACMQKRPRTSASNHNHNSLGCKQPYITWAYMCTCWKWKSPSVQNTCRGVTRRVHTQCRGSGGMLPQENFEISCRISCILILVISCYIHNATRGVWVSSKCMCSHAPLHTTERGSRAICEPRYSRYVPDMHIHTPQWQLLSQVTAVPMVSAWREHWWASSWTTVWALPGPSAGSGRRAGPAISDSSGHSLLRRGAGTAGLGTWEWEYGMWHWYYYTTIHRPPVHAHTCVEWVSTCWCLMASLPGSQPCMYNILCVYMHLLWVQRSHMHTLWCTWAESLAMGTRLHWCRNWLEGPWILCVHSLLYICLRKCPEPPSVCRLGFTNVHVPCRCVKLSLLIGCVRVTNIAGSEKSMCLANSAPCGYVQVSPLEVHE